MVIGSKRKQVNVCLLRVTKNRIGIYIMFVFYYIFNKRANI